MAGEPPARTIARTTPPPKRNASVQLRGPISYFKVSTLELYFPESILLLWERR